MTQASPKRGRLPRPPFVHISILALALCGLAACDQIDPYKRADMWRPTGANDANFELQVARASDLVRGRGTDEGDGATAAAAVQRLRADKVKRLPASGLTSGVSASTEGGDK